MRFNNYFKIQVYLVILLFISGCVTDSSSSSSFGSSSFLGYGEGIKIKSFGFSSNKVYSGQPTILSFDMQNLGAKDANDIYIYLYGLSSGDNEWFDDLSRIAYTGTNAVDDDDPRILKYDSLMSPIQSLNSNGESAYISWVLDAPKYLPEGQIFKYSAGVRVCYPYETTSTSKIEVLDDEEYLARDRENKLKKHPIIIDTSAGPLNVVMTTEQPMMLTERSKLTFRVKLVDRGSGTITDNECDEAFDWEDNVLDLFALHDRITVTLDGHGCKVGLEDLYFKLSGSGSPTADFPVTCTIPRVDVPERSFDLKMKFEYNYFIDKGTDISVEGMGINNY